MKKSLLLLAPGFLLACQTNPPAKEAEAPTPMQYPETRQDSSVADTYFGTEVADPFRWLEDDRSEETMAWGDAQNEVTYAYLENISQREPLRERLTELWNYEKYSAPNKRGNYYFFYKNDGIQNHSVLYLQENLDSEARVLIDPNTFSEDGTTSMGGTGISGDSKYMAYSQSSAGSDWQEIHVRNIETGEDLPDVIRWVKFSGISWKGDGFYYSRYPEPETGDEYSGKNEFHQLYYHQLGTEQADDELVYNDPENAQRNFYARTTEDERFLTLFSSISTSGNTFYVKDLSKENSDFVVLDETYDHEYSVIDHLDGKLLVMTNESAPKNRVILIDPQHPAKENWQELVPQTENKLESVSLANGEMVVRYLVDVQSELHRFDLEGNHLGQIELPGPGIVGGFSSEKDESTAFFSFTNYITPTTIYQLNLEDYQSTVFRQPELDFQSDAYETKQVFYTSKDGTKIPMTITHKKGLQMDGKNPTFLYGYGGFNISIKPSFSPRQVVFLENGGVYAVANLRGGGEYGEDWHMVGTKMNKQNVFDDCIAAAEYLIQEKYTSSEKLAVHGRSNGGLLVGAVMTQRPDLFQVALPQVGVLDMLRYHKFTIGWAWAGDYGTSEESQEQFNYLMGYSPLHNLEAKEYPATLVITGDHDDRVVPAHSFKFIATLQEAQKGNEPTLIRIEKSGGHGAGKPVSMTIAELADMWAFTFHHLGMEMAGKAPEKS
ncbi:MAG: prolyl oligopeptidase family protein [Salibacteraceae bacterium]